MKHVLPALTVVLCSLTACETTANRYSLYAPDKPSGPATDKLHAINFADRYNKQATADNAASAAPVEVPPPEITTPIAPPPPLPPSTGSGTDITLPAPTPIPQSTLPTPAPAPAATPAAIPGLGAPATPPAAASTPAPVATPTPSGDTPVIPGLSN